MENLVTKCVFLPDKVKAKAWNFLVGNLANHMTYCTDGECFVCKAFANTVEDTTEVA